MRLWFPSRGEERVLNLLALGLVLVLLALGFEIMKMPAAVVPEQPVFVQSVGTLALVALGFLVAWTVGRDDFLRANRGIPRVATTYLTFAILFGIAFCARGVLTDIIHLNVGAPWDFGQILLVVAGSQFATIGFFATFFFKKTDTAKVREFKRSAALIKLFCHEVRSGSLKGITFNKEFKKVEGDMKAMSDIAKAVRSAIDKDEADYASAYGAACHEIANDLGVAPTDSAVRDVVTRRAELFWLLIGGRA